MSRPRIRPLALQVTPTQEQQSVLEFQKISLDEKEASNTSPFLKWSNDSCWSGIHLLCTTGMMLMLTQSMIKKRKKSSKVFMLIIIYLETLKKSEQHLTVMVTFIGWNREGPP